MFFGELIREANLLLKPKSSSPGCGISVCRTMQPIAAASQVGKPSYCKWQQLLLLVMSDLADEERPSLSVSGKFT